MIRWEYRAIVDMPESEVNDLGMDGWELAGISECKRRTIWDPDVEPTAYSPGVPLGMETIITGVLKRPSSIGDI